MKFTRAKESWFGVIEALEDGSWMDNQALNYRRGPKIVNFLSFWSVFPNLRHLGPPDGSHRSPWPNLLFSDTKFQYLVTKSFSWNTSEKPSTKNFFFGYFQIFWPFGGPLQTPGGTWRCPCLRIFFISYSTTKWPWNKTSPRFFTNLLRKSKEYKANSHKFGLFSIVPHTPNKGGQYIRSWVWRFWK